MHKFGSIILLLGVLLFIISGFSLITGAFEISDLNTSLIAAIALIFVGTGSSIKKRFK